MHLNFKPFANPILILNDAPEALSGLARIGRDLASLLCTLPQFRVGYLARGGVGRRKFPWMQYSYPEYGQWGEQYLPQVWNDFSGGENGIVFSLWDASRMFWFGCSDKMPDPYASFLGPGRNFEKWGYFPIDGTGPNGKTLATEAAAAINGYDRVLVPSKWAQGVVKQTREDVDWIPHGIWTDRFKPSDSIKGLSKGAVGWVCSDIHVGCNMANQLRKDWPVAFECASILKREYGDRFHFWAHTNAVVNYWNLYALAADYGIEDCLEITLELTDEELALRYSACDCTIMPTSGEGFGFPIAESMACGTACVATEYAGGWELMDPDYGVYPTTFRVDTSHNILRAVLDPKQFAGAAARAIQAKRADWEVRGAKWRKSVEHLNWENLSSVWVRWFLKGLE